MREIHLEKRMIRERYKKGVTQEELASYMGVSKAAVSKWEKGLSYPDITLLPVLAAYFNISIDELMGYEPQMGKEDIRKLYRRLAEEFSSKPFEEVMEECEDVIKKYYSCFPLLLQIAVLLINHASLSQNPEEVLLKAIRICERIRLESDDVCDAKEAVFMEAQAYLMLQKPEKALELSDEAVRPMISETDLLIQIYQSMGKLEQAEKVRQISMYQHLLFLAGSAVVHIGMNQDDAKKVEETIKRMNGLDELFLLGHLYPNGMLQFYLVCAQFYCAEGREEEGVEMLRKYADLSIHELIPCSLHGDAYFNRLEEWFEEFDLGKGAPRSDKIIRQSVMQAVCSNPAFAPFKQNPGFKQIEKRLKRFAEEDKK